MSRSKGLFRSTVLCALVFAFGSAQAEMPKITGKPSIDMPPILEWERDRDTGLPDLTEPTSNRIWDLHSEMVDCDLVLSTSGNYHMALRELWYEQFLPKHRDLVKNFFYSTSPPISPEQIANGSLTFGNWSSPCRVQVAVGPKKVMDKLVKAGYTDGEPVPVIRNYGNVLLVKKGNPKNIRSIWDLARPDVRIVTSNPYTEPGSFGNYRGTIYNIAAKDPNPPKGMSAEKLFDSVFNNKKVKDKWLAGARIHHREVPWSVAYGRADTGMMFYHLARYAVESFPDRFEIVPLGGTAGKPEPLPGNKIGTLFVVKIKGDWSDKQKKAAEELVKAYQTEAFTQSLEKHGLRRPKD